VKILLEKNPRLDHVNFAEYSALYFAFALEENDIAKDLMHAGAKLGTIIDFDDHNINDFDNADDLLSSYEESAFSELLTNLKLV
jgi:hypothetical protein